MISSFSLLSHDNDTNEAEVWTITEALRTFNKCFSSNPIVESNPLGPIWMWRWRKGRKNVEVERTFYNSNLCRGQFSPPIRWVLFELLT